MCISMFVQRCDEREVSGCNLLFLLSFFTLLIIILSETEALISLWKKKGFNKKWMLLRLDKESNQQKKKEGKKEWIFLKLYKFYFNWKFNIIGKLTRKKSNYHIITKHFNVDFFYTDFQLLFILLFQHFFSFSNVNNVKHTILFSFKTPTTPSSHHDVFLYFFSEFFLKENYIFFY